MEAAGLTTSPAATPIVSAADQARIAAARPRTPPAPTVRAGQPGSAGPPSTATRPCQPRRQQAPPTSRTAPASLPSAWHAQRSAHGTARAPTTSRASIRAWCRYSRACRAAAGAAARCRASIGAPPISPGAAAAGVAGRVSGHSLRVGSAQSLVAAGAGLVELQEAGDWQTPTMPAHYARHQLAARGAVAKLRYQARAGSSAAPQRKQRQGRRQRPCARLVVSRGTPPG